MSLKEKYRKINLVRLRNIVLWSVFFIFVIVTIIIVSNKRNKISYQNIQIEIDSSQSKFVNSADIIKIIDKIGLKINNQAIDSINTALLESEIEKHPSIKNAEVYFTFTGNLIIEIEQRNPVIRIINQPNVDIYIDENGKIMPTSRNYTAHVLVVTGEIEKAEIEKYRKANKENNKNLDTCMIGKILKLSRYINEHEFWKSQIEHIRIEKNMDFVLIPRVGAHEILFGEIENIETKFNNLWNFYSKALKVEGWGKYKRINLKFENQIVCTKKI